MKNEIKKVYNEILVKILEKNIKNKFSFPEFLKTMFILALPVSLILCMLLIAYSIVAGNNDNEMQNDFLFYMITISLSPAFIILFWENYYFKKMNKEKSLVKLESILYDRYNLCSINSYNRYFNEATKVIADSETIKNVKSLLIQKVGEESAKQIAENAGFKESLISQNGISYYCLLNILKEIVVVIEKEESESNVAKIWSGF